jgi:uncharacterized Zn finger protein (UPF0148 family)
VFVFELCSNCAKIEQKGTNSIDKIIYILRRFLLIKNIMNFPIVTDVPRELLPHIQTGMLKLDARSEADANSKARLLGISKPLLTIPESFDEVQKRISKGWTVTDDGCPISGFPLLRSPDGTILWSVRMQMPTMTRQGLSENESKSSSMKTKSQKTEIPIHSVVPLPEYDQASEKLADAKASAVDLGRPLLSVKEAFDETSKRLLQGWVLMNETCPVSNFPLLKSQDGKVVWSVRCQCEIATETQANELGLQDSKVPASSNSVSSSSKKKQTEIPIHSVVPLPEYDQASEKLAGAKANAVDLGRALLDMKEAFDETSKRLLQGWVLMNETCPVSNFPLLKSQDGKVVWSVRCQCEIATETQANELGLQDSGESSSHNGHNDEDDLIYPQPRSNGMGGTMGGRTSRSGRGGGGGKISSPETAAERREALQSQQSGLISQKLLQGWKMLGETCPETGSCPLMEEPGTGRRWSAATQKFVNDIGTDEPAPVSPTRSVYSDGSLDSVDYNLNSYSRSDQPAPESPIMQAQGRWQPPTAAEAKEMQERQRRSDEWSQTMSQMLLKGWKMLDTLCPITGKNFFFFSFFLFFLFFFLFNELE